MNLYKNYVLWFCLLVFIASSGYSQQLSNKALIEDITYFKNEFASIHANAFHSISEDEFNAAVDNLIAGVDTLNEFQTYVGVMKIISTVGDGHTWIDWWEHPKSPEYLPLKFHEFSDGIFLVYTVPEYKEVLGKKLIKVGATGIEEAITRLLEVSSGDNDFDKRRRIVNSYLLKPSILYGLGLMHSLDDVTLTFEDKSGKESTIKVESRKADRNLFLFGLTPDRPDVLSAKNPEQHPLYMDRRNENFWIQYLPDKRAGYLRFLRVLNDDENKKSIDDLAAELKQLTGKENLEKLIIDVRFNGGGNNQLTKKLLHEIIKSDEVNQPGRLFLLINDYTFSAAGHFTTYIEQHTNSIIVGQPTAFSPNHYGDPRSFTLPNTGWVVSASSLYWQNSLPWDRRPYTEPDYFVDLTFDDYQNNRDPVLEFALKYDPDKDNFEQKILRVVLEGDQQRAMQIYSESRNNPLYKYQNFESLLNRLGYQLLHSGKNQAAITAFRVNIEQNPESANVYDSLAEAYMMDGQDELAGEFYQKVLEMNPGPGLKANAASKLKQLSTKH